MRRDAPSTSSASPPDLSGLSTLESYHRSLEDSDLARATHQEVLSEQIRRGVVVHGKPLCQVLRPRLLSTSTLSDLTAISQQLAGIFERAGEAILSSDSHLDLIGASDAEREIWHVDPGYPGFTLTSRLDSFLSGAHPRFVVYNAESPAGIACCDVLAEIFRSLPVATRSEVSNEQDFDARGRLLDCLMWAYGSWGGRDRPSIAIIDRRDVVTRSDFELCADYFRERGLETVICDPGALEYHQGKVWHGSQRITLVYRRVLLHELLD